MCSNHVVAPATGNTGGHGHCSQAFAGIVTVSVGHCHPEVVRAVDEQSRRLQHTTTIYLNDQIAMYAKELTDRLPGDLKVPP